MNTGRYSKPRKYIRWGANDELKCIKMLAYVLWSREAGCRNKIELWRRVEYLCPQILGAVLSKPLQFKELRRLTFEQQDVKITPVKLFQRADKADRYGEFNPYLKCVESAYLALTNVVVKPAKDTRRSFTYEQVRAKLEQQGGLCAYCRCDCTGMGVFGDHIIAHTLGGPTEMFNLAVSCGFCNSKKGKMSVLEFGKLLGETSSRGRKVR